MTNGFVYPNLINGNYRFRIIGLSGWPGQFFTLCLHRYVARLSKDAWVEWAKSTESDEDLLIILDPIINEIED